jgi:hypothetical protein
MSIARARPLAVVALYVLVCVMVMAVLQSDGRLGTSGDEPHYLVVGNAIVEHGTVETTQAYIDESVRRDLFEGELSPGFPHTVSNERGQFSVHSVGVPAMVGVPLSLAGATGARLAMIAIAALGMFAAWQFALGMGVSRNHATIAVMAVALSYAFVPAANQIYPDLPSGVFALIAALGLLGVTTAGTDRHAFAGGVVGSIAAGWLPFIHLKTGPIAIYLLVLLVFAAWRRFRKTWLVIGVAGPGLVMGAGALLLTWYLFGSPRGPYDSNALVLNEMAATVLPGLYVDQFQGLFAQAPILLVGVAALVPFVRRFPLPGAALIGSHLAFTVPNGLHPAWYGGTSFAGRFAVAGGVLLIPPTVFGLAWLMRRDRALAAGAIGLSLVAFAASMVRALGSGARLVNTANVAPDVYMSHAPWIRGVLPMFYRPAWAYSYLPNLIALGLVIALLIAGAVLPRLGLRSPQRWAAGGVAVLAVVAVVGAGVGEPGRQRFEICTCEIGTGVGRRDGPVLSTAESSGVVAFGPGALLEEGRHEFSFVLDVTEAAPSIGTWETAFTGAQPGERGPLPTEEGRHEVRVPIEVPASRDGRPVEIRIFWSGAGAFEVTDFVIGPDGEPP